jgi:hypothetical protein
MKGANSIEQLLEETVLQLHDHKTLSPEKGRSLKITEAGMIS